MSRATLLNGVLMVVLALVLFANLALGHRSFEQRNYEFLPTMSHSVPYNSFSSHPDLADGKTMQPAPVGTVARGHQPMHYAATPEDALRAGQQLQSPLAELDEITASAIRERDAELFGVYCQLCHGPRGAGDGPVAKRGFPAPPALFAENALQMADGQLFHIITYGQNQMPGHASQLDREDRWRIVRHVRGLQAAALSAATQPEPSAADNATTDSTATPDQVGQDELSIEGEV